MKIFNNRFVHYDYTQAVKSAVGKWGRILNGRYFRNFEYD